MTLTFITGNADKFKEVEQMLGMSLVRAEVDLPEIQSLDAYAVMRAKAEAARAHVEGAFIIEDTSLYLECLQGKLPGPFIKYFTEAIGNEGLLELTQIYGNANAVAQTLFAYGAADGAVEFFEGRLNGTIVAARGDQDFGWGPFFQPEGMERTFGEMTREEKYTLSMRALAAAKLKNFLEAQ